MTLAAKEEELRVAQSNLEMAEGEVFDAQNELSDLRVMLNGGSYTSDHTDPEDEDTEEEEDDSE